MSVLGFENKSSIPTKYTLPENMTTLSKGRKLQVLHELSAKVVDNFVFNSNMVDQVSSVVSEQEKRNVLEKQGLTLDARFPCRFLGCKSSFKQEETRRCPTIQPSRFPQPSHLPLPIMTR